MAIVFLQNAPPRQPTCQVTCDFFTNMLKVCVRIVCCVLLVFSFVFVVIVSVFSVV